MGAQVGLRKRRARLLAILSRGLDRPSHRLAELNAALETSPVDLKRVVAVMQGEAELTARLVRLTTGALFSESRRVTRLEDAAILLGAAKLRNLALACFLIEASRENLGQATAESFWSHALFVALLAERAVRASSLGSAEQAYIAGLLHDVGKLPLMMVAEAERSSTSIWLSSEGAKTLALEREYFGLDHCEAGHRLGMHWNLSPVLLEAIAWHHEPRRARVAPDLVGIVAIANLLGSSDVAAGTDSPGDDFVRACLPHIGEARCKVLYAILRRECTAARKFAEIENPALGLRNEPDPPSGAAPQCHGGRMNGL